MKRTAIGPRQNWTKDIEALGFDFYKVEGIPYWDETACYRFTAAEVDEIEAATNTLYGLCLRAVEQVVAQRLYPLMGIGPEAARLIDASWRRKDPAIYGRFDLIYDGVEPPKMLEFNADTPTALFEASIVQWNWRERVLPKEDQFNSIHEALVERWRSLLVGRRDASFLYLTCATPMPEDETTVQYIGQCAKEAGYTVKFLPVQDIGWTGCDFVDLDERRIGQMFKLYPWEWLVKEPFGQNISASNALVLEPPWKMLLSNKGILPILWEMYPEHPNLLPAYRSEEELARITTSIVRKPTLGREGSNVTISRGGKVLVESAGPYGDSGFVYQEFSPPPEFDGHWANVGSWIIGGAAHGIGVREDTSLIVGNRSSFVPHVFGSEREKE